MCVCVCVWERESERSICYLHGVGSENRFDPTQRRSVSWVSGWTTLTSPSKLLVPRRGAPVNALHTRPPLSGGHVLNNSPPSMRHESRGHVSDAVNGAPSGSRLLPLIRFQREETPIQGNQHLLTKMDVSPVHWEKLLPQVVRGPRNVFFSVSIR